MAEKTNLFQERSHISVQNERLVYHGSKVVMQYPEVKKGEFTKDFSWGFYCTDMPLQARRWADRFKTSGYISVFQYIPNDSLNCLKFDTMTEEWLDFIASCRSGTVHKYDIVEGPMVDDQIYNYIQDFINNKITRAAFWELAKFCRPTNQMSFHTLSAIDTLTFVEAIPSDEYFKRIQRD